MEAFDNGVCKFSTNEIVAQYFLSDYTFLISLFICRFLYVVFSITLVCKFPVSR